MRKHLSFKELVEKNKEEIIRDRREMDKVEERIEEGRNGESNNKPGRTMPRKILLKKGW